MSNTSIAYANTARTLSAVSQRRATGELTLTNDEHQWRLHFFHGRLVYATGSLHRMRRWCRAVKHSCPDFNMSHVPSNEPWEYQLLSQSVTQNQLSVPQAQAVIKMSLEEVLFSWVSNPALSSEWSSIQKFPLGSNSALSLLLSSSEMGRVLRQAQELWRHWKELELEALNPYKSPILKHSLPMDAVGTLSFPGRLIPILDGRYTLWDVACLAQRPVTTVTRFLLPWVQQGAIALEEVSDLPNPVQRHQATVPLTAQNVRPLIACVDDSPTVGEFLSAVLEPAGYRVIKIQDPLSGIATLCEHKPDLIFMDLIMPNANGYDLCNFLRKTPTFQNTPIIILTSQSSIMDRARAKLVGATDFMSKPPDPQVMLSLVRNYLLPAMATPITCKCWQEHEYSG